MKKTLGWLLFFSGLIWAVSVVLGAMQTDANISETLGRVTVPILAGLVGLYLVGIIRGSRG